MTEMINIYRYSKKSRYFWSSLLVSLNIIIINIIYVNRGNASTDDILLIVLYFGLSIYMILDLNYTKVLINYDDIRYQNIIGIDAIKWSDLEDIQLSPRLICIRSKVDSNIIKISRGEFGFSLEPFDELQEDIYERTKTCLEGRWNDLKFPLEYVLPGITLGTILTYLIPISLIGIIFIPFCVWTDGYMAEAFIFLFVSVLLIMPFIVRDYRKSCRTIILNNEGIQQRNGKLLYIKWNNVEEIIVKDPLLGYGSINVVGKENISIWIPRYLKNAGQILFLIKKKSIISESYGFES